MSAESASDHRATAMAPRRRSCESDILCAAALGASIFGLPHFPLFQFDSPSAVKSHPNGSAPEELIWKSNENETDMLLCRVG